MNRRQDGRGYDTDMNGTVWKRDEMEGNGTKGNRAEWGTKTRTRINGTAWKKKE